MRAIQEWIASGSMAAGEPLPSERVLSERLGVGRGTVRQALKRLSAEGVLRQEGGRTRGVVKSSVDKGWMHKSIVILSQRVDPPENDRYRSNWLEYVTLGTLRAIRGAGMHAVTLLADELNEADIARLAEEQPTGVVIPELFGAEGSRIERLVDRLVKAKVRTTVYGGNPELAGYDRVMSDHEQGSYELTRELIRRGCKKIVEFWPKPWDKYWYVSRHRGYERAMRESGLEPVPIVEMPEIQRPHQDKAVFDDSVRHVAGYLLQILGNGQSVDGLLLSSDRSYFATAAACRLLGRETGRDIGICGYDNYLHLCEEREFEHTLPVATIDKQNGIMGEQLVKLLIERAEGNLPPGPQTRIVAPRLVNLTAAKIPGGALLLPNEL